MNVLSLISGLFGVIKSFTNWLADRALMKAGHDKAENEQHEKQKDIIKRGLNARRDTSRNVSHFNRDR